LSRQPRNRLARNTRQHVLARCVKPSGRSLEPGSNVRPRGMIALTASEAPRGSMRRDLRAPADRIRLTDSTATNFFIFLPSPPSPRKTQLPNCRRLIDGHWRFASASDITGYPEVIIVASGWGRSAVPMEAWGRRCLPVLRDSAEIDVSREAADNPCARRGINERRGYRSSVRNHPRHPERG
jgi:hypothetical protein